VRALLETVGLTGEMLERYPHEFSGGQRQRIGLARALALDPKLVIADEPVSALDVSVRSQVLNLMVRLQRDRHLTYIFISHDLSVVEHVSDTIAIMYLGRIVEKGPADTIFAKPAHPYTRALIAATPSIRSQMRGRKAVLSGELPSPAAPPSGCVFRTRCPHAIADCATSVPALREIAPGRRVACLRDDVVAQHA